MSSKSKNTEEFQREYKKLNSEQKDAVESIEGPVMVVAGPGTGKTQILALRIGNILLKTDAKSDSILCLTFTNSAVKAMKERLRKYIGPEASKVKVSTFHSFGSEVLSTFYPVLGLSKEPELMTEKETVTLCDEILHSHPWEYIRPRSDGARYFRDLKSLISFLKRERIAPEAFEEEVRKEIKSIESDPASISSRGESKGKLKKDAEKKIEGLYRSLEAAKFYRIYEDEKLKGGLFDYDDILESLVYIMEESEEAKNFIRENFLYVLVDEHQDSSRVQNEFLTKVWGNMEKPNIFVVGDDRQLIYGFGGASLEYFENFKNAFGKAKLITLVENYRSTKDILDSSHNLLQSVITKEKLKSQSKESYPLRLVEAYYPRDEIIRAGLEIKEKIKKGEDPNNFCILVPKNQQVRNAMTILRDMDIPVAGGEMISFFDTKEAISFLQVLRVIANPGDGVSLSSSLFDIHSKIPPLKAHEFLKKNNMRQFSLLTAEGEQNLFSNNDEITVWLGKLKSWTQSSHEALYSFVQRVGSEFLLDEAENHDDLMVRIEVVRTVLHLVLLLSEKNPRLTLSQFLEFIDRVEEYGENIPLAIFGPEDGVKVLTLHASKGLEFDYVWIAHMDERSFASGRIGGFSLPGPVKERSESKDVEVLKRQLYVAITRAKRFCTVSYAVKSYSGGDQELAGIVCDIEDSFEKETAEETEKAILKHDGKAYVEGKTREGKKTDLEDLIKMVKKDYEDRKVSVSLLNNFFECPWKWYFRNLLQLPEPKNESLEFGNIIHGSVDNILKLKSIPSQPEVEKIVKNEVERSNFGNEVKQRELSRLALKIVSRWVESRLEDISSRRENELSISVNDERIPNLNIYGKIDLIERLDEENIRVTDFKTGSVRKKSDIEKMDEEGRMSGYLRQLTMYSYLIKKSPKWKVDVKESRLEFIETEDLNESFYNTRIDDEQIDLIVRDILDYDKMVKSGEWVKRPCNYNSYGKNTECEYCKLAGIYNN